MELELTATAPFALASVVNSHGWRQLLPFAWDEAAGVLRTVTVLDDGAAVPLAIIEAPAGVRVATSAPLDAGAQAQVADQVRWMLDLKRDLAPFYAIAEQTPGLAHVAPQVRGRILRSPTFFEDTVKTILTTNTAWSGTIRMVTALVERLGRPVPDAPERRAFPTPADLAAVSADDLRALGLGYRAPYVAALAVEVAGGTRDLEALKTGDLATETLRRRLLDIQGIGPYAAASLLMLLGRYDFVPIDSWARKMVSLEWYDGAPIGDAEVAAAFERFGRWQGLAYWFWRWTQRD